MSGVGVMGYGYWGPNLVRNFNEALWSRVVAVCDLRSQRACPGTSGVIPRSRTTRDYRELLRPGN